MISLIDNKRAQIEKENYLDLSDCNLATIPEIPSYAHSIIYLFLYNNNLTSFTTSPAIDTFVHLVAIDISNNIITIVTNLPPNLIELTCNNCKITSICDHAKLERLDCSHNALTEISPRYPKLSYLNCSYTAIAEIPSYDTLIELMCHDNTNLQHIGNYPKIKKADISDTNIQSISPHTYPNIEFAQFINSPITHLPYMPSLTNIVISDNNNISLDERYRIHKYIKYDGTFDILFAQVCS